MSSNFSIEEILKYKPDMGYTVYDRALDKIAELEKENNRLDKALEIAEEQAEFGRELVRQIQTIVSRETRAKEIKQAILEAIENSYMEL